MHHGEDWGPKKTKKILHGTTQVTTEGNTRGTTCHSTNRGLVGTKWKKRPPNPPKKRNVGETPDKGTFGNPWGEGRGA